MGGCKSILERIAEIKSVFHAANNSTSRTYEGWTRLHIGLLSDHKKIVTKCNFERLRYTTSIAFKSRLNDVVAVVCGGSASFHANKNHSTAGLQSASTGRRGIGGASPYVEQAPGWDGPVTDSRRFAEENKRMETTAPKPFHDCSPNRRECKNIGMRDASKTLSAQQYGVVAGRPAVEKDELVDNNTAGNKQEPNTAEPQPGGRSSVQSFRGNSWSASHEGTLLHSEHEEEEGEGAFFFSGEEDPTAGDGTSNGAKARDGTEPGASDGPTLTLQAGRPSFESDMWVSEPGTNDTISELSGSGTYTNPDGGGKDHGNEGQIIKGDESTHDSSSESPNQIRVATPRKDDDDIGASHVEQLIQERCRWKLRAFESEYELAAIQSLRARMERRDGAGAIKLRTAEATMLQASGSSCEPLSSEMSGVESGFGVNDRWQTTSESEREASASLCSAAGSASLAGARGPLGFSDTASDAQFSGAASATTEHSPASGARRDLAGSRKDHRNSLVGGSGNYGGQGKVGVAQQQTEGAGNDDYHELLCGSDKQREQETVTHRLLRKDIVELKENLRQAELRQAAAEATAASVLQRARAAELSRDVKEIQVRLSINTLDAKFGLGASDHLCICSWAINKRCRCASLKLNMCGKNARARTLIVAAVVPRNRYLKQFANSTLGRTVSIVAHNIFQKARHKKIA